MRDHELVWMIEGDAEYRWGPDVVRAPPGALVLCRPGATDFFKWDPRHRTRHGYFHFNMSSVPRSWPPAAEWPLVRLTSEGDLLRSLFAFVINHHESADPLVIKLAMAQILWAFIRGQPMTGAVPHEPLPTAVERALDHMYRKLDADPAAEISLEELARAATVTPAHLCRVFKTVMVTSPIETVWLARLDHALGLIVRSNYTIAKVAEVCGFASQFHFSRRFKQAFGQSPRDLRKSVETGHIPPLPLLLRWSSGRAVR